jgi:hypothetical protein
MGTHRALDSRADQQPPLQPDPAIDHEATAARQPIVAIIIDARTPSDSAALVRIDDRIATVIGDLRHWLNKQIALLLRELDAPILWHFPRSLPGRRSPSD